MIEAATSSTRASQKLVCFVLHGQQYAADIDGIAETMVVRPITRVFLTPPWLLGIINLRGDVVAVLDLAQLLGLSQTVPSDDSRIIIARHDDRNAGILVDKMAELRSLDSDTLQPPPATLSDSAAALITGVATVQDGSPLQVLNLPALFESDELRSFCRRGPG